MPPGAILRLLIVGIERLLVATSLTRVGGQWFVRRVCAACRGEVETPMRLLGQIGLSTDEVWDF